MSRKPHPLIRQSRLDRARELVGHVYRAVEALAKLQRAVGDTMAPRDIEDARAAGQIGKDEAEQLYWAQGIAQDGSEMALLTAAGQMPKPGRPRKRKAQPVLTGHPLDGGANDETT